MTRLCFIIILLIVNNSSGFSQETHEELGDVNWIRNYDEALKRSKARDKAILILFQEVPGCATCRNYGHNVLSNPLLVEAIENEFIPLAIFNNHKGHDRKILNQFNEPSWNNPVVRIIDPNEKELVDRISGNYSAQNLAVKIREALINKGDLIPKYLNILIEELSADKRNIAEAYYQMYCFWSGEKHLAEAHGVLETEAGWMSGREVVKVKYNSDLISEKELDLHANKSSCQSIKQSKFRVDKEPQYYLMHSDYKYLALTPLQRTKINSAIGKRENADKYLSPKQFGFLNKVRNNEVKKKSLYRSDFNTAWKLLE